MSQDQTSPEDKVAPGPSIKLLAQQVISDGRAFYEAEKSLLLAQVGWRTKLLGIISVCSAVGAVLFFIGFLVMLIVVTALLARSLGWIGAGALIGAALFLAAAICFAAARHALNSFTEADS